MADDRSLQHHSIDVIKPEALHEDRDGNVGARIEVTIGLILLTAVSIFVLIGLFPQFEIRVYANQAPATGTNTDARKLPPEPRLQDNAVQDLQQKGVVRIPIDRAIDLLALRGLPVRPAHGTLKKAGNVSSPAQAGLGSEVH